MKILKKAEQKNFRVDTCYYLDEDLARLNEAGEIEWASWYGFNQYVVYASNCKEIKVICHNGFYANVVVTYSGEQIFVDL